MLAEFPSTDGTSLPGTTGERAPDGSKPPVGVAVEGVPAPEAPDEPAPVEPWGGTVVVVGEVGTDEDAGAGSDGSEGTDTPGLVDPLVDPLPVIGASGELEPVTGARSDVAPESRLDTDPAREDPSGTTAAVRTAVTGPEERDEVIAEVRAAGEDPVELAHASTVPDAGVAGVEATLGVEADLGEGVDADDGAATVGAVRFGHADAA